jgi:lysophospholipid acyltransferase (LPLAT)-like uncharacterized protein
MPLSRTERLQTRLIAAAAYPAIAGLCRTLTWKVEGEEHYQSIIDSGRQPIIAFWHGRILPATWFFRHRGIVALTSANYDGQWIARLIEYFGNRTIAGSTSRGGVRALLALKREMGHGRPAAFALDGPRGPAHVAQPGAVWLAATTGNPLLPFHAEASDYWTASSWDRTQVPRPFSTVAVALGAPVNVPGRTASSIAATAVNDASGAGGPGAELIRALSLLQERTQRTAALE